MAKKCCCYGLTEFDFDEEKDLKYHPFWVGALSHCVPAYKPLFI